MGGSSWAQTHMPSHQSLPPWPMGPRKPPQAGKRGPGLPSLCCVTLGESGPSLCSGVFPLSASPQEMGTEDRRLI